MSRTPTPLQRRLARLLREARTGRGLSQEALADRAKVHRTYVGLLERAEREPRLSNLARLLAVLGLSWEEFGRLLDVSAADRRR
ncbi:MAG: helix-turn-helix transcriptional regulator [Gemmatimonadetes bacterium]|nr:helix-turn-helix transcriptional regulator [Gemmatimonadota bacterium]